MRTGLPSFTVTLGSLYIWRGAATGIMLQLTGQTQVGVRDQTAGYPLAHAIFASAIPIAGQGFTIEIVWCLALVALGTWMLLGTPFGNWIFGVGGDAQAARNIGVPVMRVKILLFVTT